MMNPSKIVLLVLFFGGLLGLAWTEYKQIPTADFDRLSPNRCLPELLRVNPADVRRVEIEGKDGRIVLERRPGAQWEMVQPLVTRANALQADAARGCRRFASCPNRPIRARSRARGKRPSSG